jgi:hypothetical protein
MVMDVELLRVVGSVAGIGGLGLGILLLLYQEVLRASILQHLTKRQAYRLLTLILLFVFLIALLALIAYVGISRAPATPAASACVPLQYGAPLRTIIWSPRMPLVSCDPTSTRIQTSTSVSTRR